VVEGFKKLSRFRLQFSIFLVMVAIWILFLIGSPRAFLSFPIYASFMSTIPFSAIMALALTLVIISAEIDLSFPSIMGFAGWVFTIIFTTTGNIYLAFFACLVTGIIAGFLNGVIVVKLGIPSLVATIGTMFFWRGLVMVCTGGWGKSLIPARDTVLYSTLVGRIGGRVPAQIIWTIIVAVILWLFLNRHRFGAHVYLIGDNVESARMMGVGVDIVKMIVFSVLGFCAAFAGVIASLEVSYYWPSLGEGYLLRTMSAVFLGGTSVFGGTGTIFGTFIGALIIGCLEAGIVAMGLTGFWTQLIYGVIIVISVAIHSQVRKRSPI
jgi:simple sugar transport system permease protein